jgi:hypothetical protein
MKIWAVIDPFTIIEMCKQLLHGLFMSFFAFIKAHVTINDQFVTQATLGCQQLGS